MTEFPSIHLNNVSDLLHKTDPITQNNLTSYNFLVPFYISFKCHSFFNSHTHFTRMFRVGLVQITHILQPQPRPAYLHRLSWRINNILTFSTLQSINLPAPLCTQPFSLTLHFTITCFFFLGHGKLVTISSCHWQDVSPSQGCIESDETTSYNNGQLT